MASFSNEGVTDMDTPEDTGAQASKPPPGPSGRRRVSMQLAEVQAQRDDLTRQLAEVQAQRDDLTRQLAEVQARRDDRTQQRPEVVKQGPGWVVRTLIPAIVGAFIAAAAAWFTADYFQSPPPEPEGKITSPVDQSTVTHTFAVTGTLSYVPEGRHVSLAVLSQGNQVPLRMKPISSDERSWHRVVRVTVPAGQPFSLVLRMDNPGRTTITQLSMVNGLKATTPPCRQSALQCLMTPAKVANGARLYSFRHGRGNVTADITSNAVCRQPNRSVGLSVDWTMPANSGAYGGWGMYWPARHIDLSAYSKMVLSIRGRGGGGETFQIAMQDSANRKALIESRDVPFVASGNWQEMSVPLEKFKRPKRINRASVVGLSLGWNDTHGSGGLCIDEIAFR